MAEVQQRYSADETAQLEALSDRLLSSFKEATFDLGKLIATKGLDVVRGCGCFVGEGVGVGGRCLSFTKAGWRHVVC